MSEAKKCKEEEEREKITKTIYSRFEVCLSVQHGRSVCMCAPVVQPTDRKREKRFLFVLDVRWCASVECATSLQPESV